ncbi:MAG TPA: RnfABCDGE type electron transport complex subunit G [Nitrospirota bacterium]|nr:RnfABCDGE type electron transport complex subunit G [Nitrospirota bacterium]
MLKITLPLVVIFVVAGVIMAMTYQQTYPVRFQAEKKEKEEALKEMAPNATDPIKPAGTWNAENKTYEYYRATADGKPVAYISETAGKGYSSFIKMLVSLGPDMKVNDVKVMDMNETPGLGDQVLEKSFLDQFKGKALTQIVLIKGETKENIQAISGATYSSRGVTNGVRDAVKTLMDNYGAGVNAAAAQGVTK